MRTIHKVVLSPNQGFVVETHASAKVLTVGEQDLRLCVWLEVDTDMPLIKRHFYVVGTGHQVPEGAGEYHGTAMFVVPGGMGNPGPQNIVLHVYEGEKEFDVVPPPSEPRRIEIARTM